MNTNEVEVGKISEELEKLITEMLCRSIVGQTISDLIPMEDMIKKIKPMEIIEKYHLNKTINGIWIGTDAYHRNFVGDYAKSLKWYITNIKSIDSELYDMLITQFISKKDFVENMDAVTCMIYTVNTVNITDSPENDVRLLALRVKDIRDIADMVDGIRFSTKSMMSGDQNQLYKELEDLHKDMLKRNREWYDGPRGRRQRHSAVFENGFDSKFK